MHADLPERMEMQICRKHAELDKRLDADELPPTSSGSTQQIERGRWVVGLGRVQLRHLEA